MRATNALAAFSGALCSVFRRVNSLLAKGNTLCIRTVRPLNTCNNRLARRCI